MFMPSPSYSGRLSNFRRTRLLIASLGAIRSALAAGELPRCCNTSHILTQDAGCKCRATTLALLTNTQWQQSPTQWKQASATQGHATQTHKHLPARKQKVGTSQGQAARTCDSRELPNPAQVPPLAHPSRSITPSVTRAHYCAKPPQQISAQVFRRKRTSQNFDRNNSDAPTLTLKPSPSKSPPNHFFTFNPVSCGHKAP